MARPSIPTLPDWRRNRMARDQVRNFSYVMRAIAMGRLPGEQTLSRGAVLSRLFAALVMTTVLWFYITTQENPVQSQAFSNLQVAALHIPKGLAIRNSLQAVTITARGLQSEVNGAQQLSPVIDLSDVPTSAREVKRKVLLLGTDHNLEYTIVPAVISLRLEPLVVRQVPVIFIPQSSLATGLDQVGQAQISPPVVTISGPQDQVAQVASATVASPLNNIGPPNAEQSSFAVSLPLVPQLADKQGHILPTNTLLPPSTKVKVTLQISQVIQLRTLTIAPIISVGPPPGYELGLTQPRPLTVAVIGPPDLVSSLKAVTTTPINLQSVTHSMTVTTQLDVQSLPQGVFLYSPGRQGNSGSLGNTASSPGWSVYVSVTAATSDQQIPARITLRHLGPGLRVHLDSHWVIVYVKGPYSAISALGPLHAQLDLTGLGPGTYSLHPRIDLPATLPRYTASPPTVGVTISTEPVPPTATPRATPSPKPTRSKGGAGR